jgi:hypothetical protein
MFLRTPFYLLTGLAKRRIVGEARFFMPVIYAKAKIDLALKVLADIACPAGNLGEEAVWLC